MTCGRRRVTRRQDRRQASALALIGCLFAALAIVQPHAAQTASAPGDQVRGVVILTPDDNLLYLAARLPRGASDLEPVIVQQFERSAKTSVVN